MIEQKPIKLEQQIQSPPMVAQQNPQSSFAHAPLSADLFLFQQIVIDILNHCKRNLKVHPFDQMQIDKLVQNNKSQSIDIYQQYFLIGIGTSKTRQYVCNKYEQLVRDKLINKDFLPPQMITGIINARAVGTGGGGSTASSGSNSIVGSAMNLNSEKSYNIGKLISSIICYTLQPSSEISAGLVYLLEGTRNKNNGGHFTQLVEDTYTNLNQFKKKPLDRFLGNFLRSLVNQIEYHETPYFQYERKYLHERRKSQHQKQNILNISQGYYKKVPSIMQQSNLENSAQPQSIPQPPQMHEFIKKPRVQGRKKQDMCQHPDQDAKFGKCFICERGASNYDKTLFVPLCGMECKNKLKRINQQCLLNDHFDFMRWLLETLVQNNTASDEVLYTLLLREVEATQSLSEQQIGIILEIIVNNFSLQSIGINIGIQSIQASTGVTGITGNKLIENSALIMAHLVRKYTKMMFKEKSEQNQKQLMKEGGPQQQAHIEIKVKPNFFHSKVIILQMVRMLQSLPILNTTLQLTLLKALMEIVAARFVGKKSQESIIVMKELYVKCDCQVLQTNIVERILNLISQYSLQSNTSSNSNSNSNVGNQNIGTNTSLSMDNTNALTLGIINNVSIGGTNCSDVAINGLEEILNSLVQSIESFDHFSHSLEKNEEEHQIALNLIKQKKIKSYIQSKFVEDFNKKPGKAVDKLRKLFNNQITARDVAILIRQNMDYQTKVKKIKQKINKQQVGTFFGTAKKDKNKEVQKQDFNQQVYWEFLRLLQKQFRGRQIDDCLRITFNSFMMPKQGQQVEVVLGPLSLVLEPYLGLKEGNQATATYQLIMVALMVQTSNNPNVKQNEKLKFEGFKNFCSEIDKDLSQARMTQIYDRIKKRPLEILMQYKGADIFQKKYLKPELLKTQFWKKLQDQSVIQIKQKQKPKQKQKAEISSMNQSLSSINMSMNASMVSVNSEIKSKDQKTQQSERTQQTQNTEKIQQEISQVTKSPQRVGKNQSAKNNVQSKDSINMESSMIFEFPHKKLQSFLSFTLSNLWQFVYMSLVNKNNLKGLEQSCILYGRCQLTTQFQAFFNNLYKLHKDYSQKSSSTLQSISNQAKLIILKLAIDYSNYVIGRQSWLIIIKIIYKLDYDEQENTKPSTSKKPESSYAYYEYEASDKLFTRTNTFKSERLKQFLEAMCQFSSSQAKTDRKYTREMYILHHIAEIIEYNLERFQQEDPEKKQSNLWNVVWPTIRNYFRNICIHPRKQIAMSAIDSYKQLAMKMIKVNPIEEGHINHAELMNVYLYVFERSPAYIKDLIINVLLNVVSKDMRSGWEEIYTILEISDSEDKTVVMKVINRLVKDIQLKNATNLIRLHQILIKQLRIANEDGYSQVMDRLWDVCDHFARIDLWLETLAKVKDIYKSTTDVNILAFLYKICNNCIKIAYQKDHSSSHLGSTKVETHKPTKKHKQKKVKNESNQQLEQQQSIEKIGEIEDQISTNILHEALSDGQFKQNGVQQLKSQQIHKLVYFEVFSVQMHILQIKSPKLFADSVNIFKQLNLDVFFRNLGNSEQNKTGFISLWQMFLTCNNSIQFCYFLHDYFGLVWEQLARIQICLLKNQRKYKEQPQHQEQTLQLHSIKNLDQLHYLKKHILLWLIRTCMQGSKDQVLHLTEEDPDLKKSFRQIIQQQQASSGKTELIQFYFSSKQYEAKSIQHLVFLKIFKLFYDSQCSIKQQKSVKIDQSHSLDDLNKRILQIVVESYQTASQINNKPLLRNFLWNNQFFKGQQYLPGLMKQQLRAYQLIVKYFGIEDMQGRVYKIIFAFILEFIEKTLLLLPKNANGKLKQTKQDPKMPFKVISGGAQPQNQQTLKILQIIYQDLGLWITNAEQVILQTLRKLATQLKKSKNQEQKQESKYINYGQLFNSCLQLSQVTASSLITKECGCVLQELTIKMF